MRTLTLLAAALLTVAGGPAVAAGSQTLGGDVDSLLAYARDRHPEFAALRAEADAAAARVGPAAALADPMLRTELRDFTNEGGVNAGGGANLLPARIGGARYTLSQSLPWFGKRDLRGDIATAGADAARNRAAAGWVELAWRIKQTYAQHHLHMASLRYGRENLALLDQLERIAQARYANGLAPQQDVIRAQTERTALQSELVLLEGDNEQSAARILALLGLPEQGGQTGGVRLLPPERLRALPPPAALARTALETRLADRNPRLAADAAGIAAADKSRELAWRNRYPDFNVGLSANQVRDRVASWDLMVEINIPLQQERRREQEREAERMLDAAKLRRASTLNQALSDLNESLVALRAARRVEDLVATSLLPQAELTLQAALAGYETGKVDFAAVLDAQRRIRDSKEDLVRARVQQRLRLADIERAIGEEL
ncbi:MAG: TolC family protein [Pseudomonadota bacterium]